MRKNEKREGLTSMALEIIRNDITNMRVDAIVNTANPRPVIGAGTDTAIHRAAGPELLEARRKVGYIPRGTAAITPAFRLDAKYVIHAVTVGWKGGKDYEAEILRKAYESALALARQYHCRSIAFPLMGSGSYGFPKDLALSIAVRACNAFLQEHQMKIFLVVFNQEAYQLSRQLTAEIRSYIDDHYVEEQNDLEYRYDAQCLQPGRAELWDMQDSGLEAPRRVSPRRNQAAGAIPPVEQLEKSLRERLQEQHETFTESMLRIMRENGWYDADVYGRIFMDRKTFNKIKNNPEHHPQRKTALQLAIALRLNLDQTRDFIGKAGYALSASSKADVILAYCIENQITAVDQIDAILDRFGEKTVFSLK